MRRPRVSPPGRFFIPHDDHELSNTDLQEEEMTTVASIFRKRIPCSTVTPHPLILGCERLGVEVELENIRSRMPASRYWEVKSDGSLRNSGAEFVFREPLGGKDLYDACINLDSMLYDKNPDPSWRCSVHVHIDVRDLTPSQVKKFILVYATLERILFDASGWQRYRNNFCCALGFAQQQVETLSRLWTLPDNRLLQRLVESWSKYSAINLIPMRTFGSIEIRISEAKWKKGQLIRHCNRMLAIKEIAKSWDGSEEDLIGYLLSSDPRTLFPKGLPKEIPLAKYQDDLVLGAKIAYEIRALYAIGKTFTLSNETGAQQFETTRRSDVWEHVLNNTSDSSEELSDLMANYSSMPEMMTFDILLELTTEHGYNQGWFLPVDSEYCDMYQSYYESKILDF